MPMDPTLISTALLAGFLHTLAGPDHYLPILGLARARDWSLGRSLWVGAGLGLLHCLSSLLLVFVLWLAALPLADSLVAGLAGSAAWLMIAAGVALLVQALRYRRAPMDGRLGFGILAVAFFVGPCEWLLPVAMQAGQAAGLAGLLSVSMVYTAATLATMLACVALGQLGLRRVVRGLPAQYALAAVTLLCGVLMLVGF